MEIKAHKPNITTLIIQKIYYQINYLIFQPALKLDWSDQISGAAVAPTKAEDIFCSVWLAWGFDYNKNNNNLYNYYY